MRLSGCLVLLLLGLPTALAGQTSQSAELAAVRRGIEAGNAAYIAAFKKADAEALAEVYDSHGARLTEGGVVAHGRSAIAADVGRFLSQVGPVRVTLETKDVWLVDDIAYETGLWSYAFLPRGTTEQRIVGRYVTVWRRQRDGGWKIWADMGVPGT
jgi:uncharacterized protein (TIGR02246 family)